MKRLSLMVLVLFLGSYTIGFSETYTVRGEFDVALGKVGCINFEGIAKSGGQAGAVDLNGDEFVGIALSPGPGADGMFVGIPDLKIPGGNNENFFAFDFFPTSGVAVFSPDAYPGPGSPSPDGALIVDFHNPNRGVGAFFLDVEFWESSIEAFDGAGATGNSLGKLTLQNMGDNSQAFAGIVANGIRSAILKMGGGGDGVGIDDLCFGALRVDVDIKPTSCPNPLNVKSKGVLPVAILGTEDFDVTAIDPTTVLLEGIGAIRYDFEDVATPVDGGPGEDCQNCTDEGPDGKMDLTLKFNTVDIVAALGEVEDGDELCLELTGELFDETPILGEDGVRIINKGIKGKGGGNWAAVGSLTPMVFALHQNNPNPFARETSISYTLPASGHTTLKIYDTSGRLVTTLVDAEMNAGVYSTTWNRKNSASGIYFYRLTSGGSSMTKAMTVIR